jgi:hypothetical protein
MRDRDSASAVNQEMYAAETGKFVQKQGQGLQECLELYYGSEFRL